MNGQVEVTRITLRTIAHSIMVYARVLEAYINFALMYMADHILMVPQIKYLINEDDKTTMPFKLVKGTGNSVPHLYVLFYLYVVWKATAHVGKKVLNIRHQAQKDFCGIFVGITQHQRGHLLYVTNARKIIYS